MQDCCQHHTSNKLSHYTSLSGRCRSNNGGHKHKNPDFQPSINSSISCCCDTPHKHRRNKCTPRFGELVSNGGFENPQNTFQHWIINPGVDAIDPGMGDTAHQGFAAARLGFIAPQASIFQDIPGICPGRFYQLSFVMGTEKDLSNSPVTVRLIFLNKYKNPLGNPALNILIPLNSLFESYSAFINPTQFPAPRHARFARIFFETNTGADADRYVILDDVSLITLESGAHSKRR